MSSNLLHSLLLSLCLSLIAAPAQAQYGLEVKVLASQSTYLLGEPVHLYIRIKNINNPSILLPEELEPEYGLVGLEIRRAGYPVRHYRGGSHKCLTDAYSASVPGDMVYGTTKVLADGQGPAFPSVGSYRVRATYLGACSEEVTVKVVDSLKDPNSGPMILVDGKAPREALKYLSFNGGDHLVQGLSLLNAWANSREPALAAHFNLARGTAFLDDFADFTRGQLRAADPGRAVSYLEQVRANPADLFTHVQAHILLEEGYTKLGKVTSASAIRAELNQLVSRDYAAFSPWIDHLKQARAAYLHARVAK